MICLCNYSYPSDSTKGSVIRETILKPGAVRIPNVADYLRRGVVIILLLMLTLYQQTSNPAHGYRTVLGNRLEQIKQSGRLRVLVHANTASYSSGDSGAAGFEHDLVLRFARHLGVEVEFLVLNRLDHLMVLATNGVADIAAAGLTITEQRRQMVRFAPSYQQITEQVIYRSGTRRPHTIADLASGTLEVAEGSSHIETLQALKKQAPQLVWESNTDPDSDDLFYLVNGGLIDYTIADSNQVRLMRRFYPSLHVAFDLAEPRQVAWALAQSEDNSLYDELVRFFARIKQDKTLAQLIERHYGHTDSLDYVGNCSFRKHIAQRLPKYQRHFKKAAEALEIDWRLLAAMGYQESHWRNNAVSPTGVRGIMMLTNDTADFLGVADRTDPVQSIDGGARYFSYKKDKLADNIQEPDRTWLALAAYNIGVGHLEDARRLAKRNGADPNRWLDVKKYLPLLSQSAWHKQTRYGYARGSEPVHYVKNIRNYYDMLVWLTDGEKRRQHPVVNKQKERKGIVVARNSVSNWQF